MDLDPLGLHEFVPIDGGPRVMLEDIRRGPRKAEGILLTEVALAFRHAPTPLGALELLVLCRGLGLYPPPAAHELLAGAAESYLWSDPPISFDVALGLRRLGRGDGGNALVEARRRQLLEFHVMKMHELIMKSAGRGGRLTIAEAARRVAALRTCGHKASVLERHYSKLRPELEGLDRALAEIAREKGEFR